MRDRCIEDYVHVGGEAGQAVYTFCADCPRRALAHPEGAPMPSERTPWWRDPTWVGLLLFLAAALTYPLVEFGPWSR